MAASLFWNLIKGPVVFVVQRKKGKRRYKKYIDLAKPKSVAPLCVLSVFCFCFVFAGSY